MFARHGKLLHIVRARMKRESVHPSPSVTLVQRACCQGRFAPWAILLLPPPPRLKAGRGTRGRQGIVRPTCRHATQSPLRNIFPHAAPGAAQVAAGVATPTRSLLRSCIHSTQASTHHGREERETQEQPARHNRPHSFLIAHDQKSFFTTATSYPALSRPPVV